MVDSTPSCLQTQYHFMQFAPGTPNTISLAGIDQGLANMLPLIGNIAANELQAAVQRYNMPEMIYLFNGAFNNNFQNDVWGVLVEETAMAYVHEKRTNQYVQDQDAIARSARRVIASFASFLASQNQTVMSHIPVNRHQEVINFANTYISESQYRKQLRQSITMSGGGGMMPNSMVNAGNISTAGIPQMPVSLAGNTPSPGAGLSTMYGGPANSFQVAIKAEEAITPTPAANNLLARFIKPSKPVSNEEAPVVEPVKLGSAAPRTVVLSPKGPVEMFRQPSAAAAPTSAPVQKQVDFNPVAGTVTYKWQPSTRQYFKPAFNAMRQKHIVEQVTAGGVTHSLYKVTNQDETEMKRSEHEIGSLTSRMVSTYLPVQPIPASEQVDESLTLTSAALAAVENKESSALTAEMRTRIDSAVLAGNEPKTFVSLSAAVATARHDAMLSGADKTYIMPASISMYNLSRQDRSDFFNNYMDISSFEGMVHGMKEFLKDKPTKDAVDFIARMDLHLTREINSVFRVQMGLQALHIDSFLTDILDCKGVIQSNVGAYYLERLEAHEQVFLSNFFSSTSVNEVLEEMPIPEEPEADSTVDADIADAIDEGHVAEAAKSDEPVVSFYEYYNHNDVTVCVVDQPRDAFAVVLPEGETQEVFENTLPGLFKYITAVIAADPEAAHHYIVTSDDYVYEVAKSIVGEALVISGRPRLQ